MGTKTEDDKDRLDVCLVQDAMRLAAEEAKRHKVNAVIAIMNSSGVLFGLLKMPNSFLASGDYAQWKAWTTVSFGMSSREFGQLLNQLDPQARQDLLAHPKVTALPGGFPIHHAGQIIGAIGISGGDAEQDEMIAQAGLRAFTE